MVNIIRNKIQITLLGIIILGFVLRLYGVAFGLPELWHPDEDAVVMPALEILRTGEWQPIRMEYGSFHIYILTAISAVVTVLLMRDGHISSASEIPIYARGTFPSIYHQEEFFVAARFVSVVTGTLTILIIFLLARRLTDSPRQALLAGLFTAILPRFVVHSHFATTDMSLMFWITVALYLLLRVYDNWESDSWWSYAGAGIVCGIATSTKYNGVLLMLPLLSVALLRVKSLERVVSWRTISGAVGMIVGFLASTPYVVLALPEFLDWFGFSLRLYNLPTDKPVTSMVWHLDYHLRQSYAPLFLLAFIGIPLSFWKWKWRGFALNIFALVFWFTIFQQTNSQVRMWLPTAPVVILWSVLTLDTFFEFVYQRFETNRHVKWFPYIVTILIATPMLLSAARIAHDLSYDGRLTARVWIEDNIAEGTSVAVDYLRPNIDPERWSVTNTFFLYDNDLQWYQERGVEYLVLHDAINDFDRQDIGRREQYETFVAQLCLVHQLREPTLGYYYTIFIYHMPPCS